MPSDKCNLKTDKVIGLIFYCLRRFTYHSMYNAHLPLSSISFADSPRCQIHSSNGFPMFVHVNRLYFPW